MVRIGILCASAMTWPGTSLMGAVVLLSPLSRVCIQVTHQCINTVTAVDRLFPALFRDLCSLLPTVSTHIYLFPLIFLQIFTTGRLR